MAVCVSLPGVTLSAEDCVSLAKYAERVERYDEMADFMGERVKLGGVLNAEERDIFSAAFKGALTSCRSAVGISFAIERQETQEGRMSEAQLAAGYRSRCNNELRDTCTKVLGLLEHSLVPSAPPGEPKVFYYKMMADYHRYVAESCDGTMEVLRDEQAQKAHYYYAMGTQEAAGLKETHPVRLGLALNFSVFQHEVMRDTGNAIVTARNAVEQAVPHLGANPERDEGDALMTLQLLSDNLTLWQGA